MGADRAQPRVLNMTGVSPWTNKRVLVTGVCGTVGRELLRLLLLTDAAEIVGVDNNESELFLLGQELRDRSHTRFYLCDICDPICVQRHMEGIDVVLHTAALKHVDLCEHSPHNAMRTNISGVQNIIGAARLAGVERMLFTSSDKAVNPTSVMGTSKLMGERLMTAADAGQRDGGTIFSSTRFGNVMGSNGSVIPLFRRLIATGGPITLTSDEMTRFVMTLTEAAKLVMGSVFLAQGGEVFATKMPVVRIDDLAQVMVEELAPRYGYDPDEILTEIIGTRPGEKLYEDLINGEETRRTVDLPNYYSILPALSTARPGVDYTYGGTASPLGIARSYTSDDETAMTREELRHYMRSHDLLFDEDAGTAAPKAKMKPVALVPPAPRSAAPSPGLEARLRAK